MLKNRRVFQDFLVILKRKVQNHKEILKTLFWGWSSQLWQIFMTHIIAHGNKLVSSHDILFIESFVPLLGPKIYFYLHILCKWEYYITCEMNLKSWNYIKLILLSIQLFVKLFIRAFSWRNNCLVVVGTL